MVTYHSWKAYSNKLLTLQNVEIQILTLQNYKMEVFSKDLSGWIVYNFYPVFLKKSMMHLFKQIFFLIVEANKEKLSTSIKKNSVIENIPEISVNSLIKQGGIKGGSLLEKKSLRAVATAFTGISNSRMEIEGSEKK